MKNNYFILLLLLLLLIYYISSLFRIHKNTFYEGNEIKTANHYGFSPDGDSVQKNGGKLMGIMDAMVVDSSKILVNPKIGDYGIFEIGTNCDFDEETRVPLSMYWDGRSQGENVGLVFEPINYMINNINYDDIDISSASSVSETCSKVINVECRTDGVISYKDGYLLDTEIASLRDNGMELETESSESPHHNPPPPPPMPPPSQDIEIPSQDSEISQIELDPNFGSSTESGSTPGPLTSVISSLY